MRCRGQGSTEVGVSRGGRHCRNYEHRHAPAVGEPKKTCPGPAQDWPAPDSEDTELSVFMGPEVRHGEAEVHARVQA